ncbi:hypothetical protein KIL84_009414 [Mauremys mutica]|uniref:RING-type E3 ubiquitin transferase n=1 Tax=Mauremys mutica TaxID=74926 RepID=A0A9D3XJR0_9SAUR|nr:hypothetical protein KIL84_009414 [Mauremys mutica]
MGKKRSDLGLREQWKDLDSTCVVKEREESDVSVTGDRKNGDMLSSDRIGLRAELPLKSLEVLAELGLKMTSGLGLFLSWEKSTAKLQRTVARLMAKRAVQRGATAVIFDVSENPDAIDQLNQGSEDPLKRPVVYVKGADAVKLMNIVNKQKVARARIQHRPPRQPTEYFDMGIFLAFFVVVSLVCLILLVKIKLKQRRSQVRAA